MQYNFADLKITGLDGTLAPNLKESIGNAIYSSTKDTKMLEVAKKIYRWEKCELDEWQVEKLKEIMKDETLGFYTFVQKAMTDFLDNPTKE